MADKRHALYDLTLGRFVGPVGDKSAVDKFRADYKPRTGDDKPHKVEVREVE